MKFEAAILYDNFIMIMKSSALVLKDQGIRPDIFWSQLNGMIGPALWLKTNSFQTKTINNSSYSRLA